MLRGKQPDPSFQDRFPYYNCRFLNLFEKSTPGDAVRGGARGSSGSSRPTTGPPQSYGKYLSRGPHPHNPSTRRKVTLVVGILTKSAIWFKFQTLGSRFFFLPEIVQTLHRDEADGTPCPYS